MVSQRTRGIDNNLNWYTASLLLDRSGGGVCNREWSRPRASPQARRFGWPHIWYRWGMLRRADHGSPCSQGFHPDAGASLHPFQYHTSVGPHHVGGATSHTSSAHCRGPPSLLCGNQFGRHCRRAAGRDARRKPENLVQPARYSSARANRRARDTLIT